METTDYALDEAAAINQRLREYKANKNKLEAIDESERSELQEVKDFYAYKRSKLEEDNERLKQELLGFIDTENGQTSVTTSMGNVQARTTKDSWKWGSKSTQQKAMKSLPSELLKTVTELDKPKIKEATTITDDGKVVLNDTGEIINGLSGIKGGQKQVVIRLDK
ncbi:host-nuclease inhibitor Gam family protein [Limosilactobacillus vaginalis]|uniref:host-nuclease inhibitor Gam family protein n=1 Tax=Limosilactobacillus vaginalis TaxID=1633 RepID=UPI00265DD404|nr:host-nuclease inhibitor Gam family protein [Limosilactobacillus vaginalis]